MPPGTKLKEKLRKLQLSENFPSERVSLAYLNPEVDNSNEKFSWAIPNFVEIKDYAGGFLHVRIMIIIVYGSILPPFPNNWAAIVG
jgi:hypothetical protein